MSAPRDQILVTSARAADAAELAELLNAIIMRAGSTAYEEPFTMDQLATAMMTAPNVLCCLVAREEQSDLPGGFQALYRSDALPEEVVDIATYTRPGLTRRGSGLRFLPQPVDSLVTTASALSTPRFEPTMPAV